MQPAQGLGTHWVTPARVKGNGSVRSSVCPSIPAGSRYWLGFTGVFPPPRAPLPGMAPGRCCNGTDGVYGANPPSSCSRDNTSLLQHGLAAPGHFFTLLLAAAAGQIKGDTGHPAGPGGVCQTPAPIPTPPVGNRTHRGRLPARRVGDGMAPRGMRRLNPRDPIAGLPPPPNHGCCLVMGAAGCGSWELPHWDLRPPAWGKACGRSPVGAAGSCARGRGARGQCQWAGLFSTICLARPEAAAGQGRWRQLLRLCCYLWHREEKWGKKGQKAAGWTPPFAASCSPLRPAPNPVWALWGAPGLGGHEQRGGQGLPPRRSWGLTRGDVSGLREVHAGCPAQPHIPEGWKAAWGQGLGWGLQPKSSCCFLPGVRPSTLELNPQTPSRGSLTLQPWGQGVTWSQPQPQIPSMLAGAGQAHTPPACFGASSGTKITPRPLPASRWC